MAWTTLWQEESVGPRGILLLALTTIWGVRLAAYLTWRNWGEEEDRRYRKMREAHGSRFIFISLFTVFGLQAVLLWIISLPLQVAMGSPESAYLHWYDGLGILLWVIGMFFESVGDWQLARFKSDPAHQGKVLDQGLWKYTRHPNYFGDFCVWWGLFLIAIFGGAAWTFFSPLLMSFLLLKVSGVTLLEKDISERRPEYQHYQRRTSAFFPWPPRAD